ncbi:MAG: hypothetical protein ACLP7J_04490 [Streptosporangiaceae bacterium]
MTTPHQATDIDVQTDALEAATRARDSEQISRIFRHMQAEGVSSEGRLTVLRTVIARIQPYMEAGQ